MCAGRWVSFSRLGTRAGSCNCAPRLHGLRARAGGEEPFQAARSRFGNLSEVGSDQRSGKDRWGAEPGAREDRGSQPAQQRPRGTAHAPCPSASRYPPPSSVFLCFETKAQLMDSRRSEDPLRGATLMYCCPISAFNWCPRGRAGPELGHNLLSPLPHARKVKFITRCSKPWGARATEGRRKGTDSSVSQGAGTLQPPEPQGAVDKGSDNPGSTQFPGSFSGLAGGLGRLSR